MKRETLEERQKAMRERWQPRRYQAPQFPRLEARPISQLAARKILDALRFLRALRLKALQELARLKLKDLTV